MLTTKQKQYLKKLGHHLDPIINIGKETITPNVVQHLIKALSDHELVKIKINSNALSSPKELVKDLEALTKADVIQTIGKMLLIYKENSEEPKIRFS